MQIFAASSDVKSATPTPTQQINGQTLEAGKGVRGDYLMPWWWWLAHDLGNNLYANAHADAKCPAARKQETNYAREQLWNSIKTDAPWHCYAPHPHPPQLIVVHIIWLDRNNNALDRHIYRRTGCAAKKQWAHCPLTMAAGLAAGVPSNAASTWRSMKTGCAAPQIHPDHCHVNRGRLPAALTPWSANRAELFPSPHEMSCYKGESFKFNHFSLLFFLSTCIIF